jgi:FkbM family methyltransferase
MLDEVRFASWIASDAIENLLVRGKRLHEGLYGLTPAEMNFYNYYIENPLEDRSLIKSQLLQDLWVAFILKCWDEDGEFSRSGFFVEFGAFDGVTLSNSYLLEKRFGWGGVLAEPNPDVFPKIIGSRNCRADDACVWSSGGGTVSFNRVMGNEILGTVDSYSLSDKHADLRRHGRSPVDVHTKSLMELLDDHESPGVVDYMSVDTEGSELEILGAFDFGKYQFRVVSVEHNDSDKTKSELKTLMEGNGYALVPRSTDEIDYMFVLPDLIPDASLIF